MLGRRCFLLLLSIICALTPLAGCSSTPPKYTDEGFGFFDTFYLLTVYTDDQAEFDRYADICRNTIKEYHQLLDIYHSYDDVNNLKTVNDHAGEPVEVEPRLYDFLQYAKEMYTLTRGYTNIAMGSVTALWHEKRVEATEGKPATLPDPNAIAEALTHTSIEVLQLSEDGKTVTLTDPHSSLDAGALGKGYVAQRIADLLIKEECESFLLNMGGNTVAHGTKPQNQPWLIGIQTPEGHEGYPHSIRLMDRSLVTSGSYERNLTVNGIQYHHIIHPRTGYPDTVYLSVSVLCNNSALADALSTALFSMPAEEGLDLIDALPNTEALWLCSDGTTLQSSGWKNYAEGEVEQK